MSAETLPEWAGGDQAPSGASIPIDISGETALPLAEIVTGRGFMTGKSGSGKSNSMGVVVEEVLDRGIPVCIIDTEGEYIGLKDQYTILHAGAHESCDVTVSPRDASAIADIVLERHIPVVLDTSEFLEGEVMNELVVSVVRHLFKRQKTLQHPMLLVVEECHEFIPQRGGEEVKEMFITIAKRGRKRGLGLCGLSQRPASVDKDFITQCDWNVWHRLTWPNDVAVASEVLGDHAAAVEGLDDGESLVWADWTDACQRVQWRQKRTRDYGSAPAIDRALGSTPDRIDAEVFDSFERGDLDVELPESARECLEALQERLDRLGDEERYMLDYVHENGPVDPKPAYALTGGSPESKVVYEHIRTLREEQFIAKAGRGVYEYALPDRVEAHLKFHPEIGERHILALVERLESEFEGIADEPTRSDSSPDPGDVLGTYRIHDNGNGGGYAQLGKPVTEYLAVVDGDAVTVTPCEDDAPQANIRPGADGKLVYSASERAHKDYAAFSITASGIDALGGEPGDSLRVTAANDHTIHVDVEEGL